MKKTAIIISVLVAGILCSAYRAADNQANAVFQALGISQAAANEFITGNLLYTSLNTPAAALLKKTAPEKRKLLVLELGNYMKAYFRSEEVAQAYREYRESLMPGRQEGIDVASRIEEIQRDIENTEKDRSAAPANMKALYDETIVLLRSQLEILNDPSHPDYAMYSGIVPLTPEEQKEINRQIKEFSKEYPEDIQLYLKLKLQEFLELTSDIDFNAKLIQKNGKWKFENPDYEAKSYPWKKCFRAGRETIETARAFAQEWVAEINSNQR